MKTAISIPDNLYLSVQIYMKKKKISRSRLFVKAVEEYLQYHQSGEITSKLDKIYSKEDSKIGKDMMNVQLRSIPGENW